MGLEDEIRKLQLAAQAAALAEAARNTTAAQQQAAETQARIAREHREQSAKIAKSTQLAQAVRSRLDEALNSLEPEKVLKEVQKLWGTGTIDSEPIYRPYDPAAVFDYEFAPSATLGIRYAFPVLEEQVKELKGKPIYSEYGDEGVGRQFLGYEKVKKHNGWKRVTEELSLEIGVRLPSLGGQPEHRLFNLELNGDKLLDRVDVDIGGSGAHETFGLTNDIIQVQDQLRQSVAQVYVTMPHPNKIIPFQMIHEGKGRNLTDPTLTASWFRRLITR